MNTPPITREDYFRYRHGLMLYGQDMTQANQRANLWLKENGTSYAELFNAENPASITVSRALWQSVSISLDQQETPGTEDVSEEIIHTTRAGAGVAVKCADSLGAQTILTRALRANPAASHFVFVKRAAPCRKNSAASRNRVL